MDAIAKFQGINLLLEADDNKNKNKNKELLLVSLLEYIFLTQNKDSSNKIFQNICDYILNNKIIDNVDLLTNKYEKVRDVYIKQIENMVNLNNNNHNNITKTSVSSLVIYDSRYKNDFVEMEKIGIGGFGIVYKARHKLDNILYAIKKVPIKNINHSNYSKILNEVNCLASLNDDKIIRYYSSWIEFMDSASNDILEINEDSGSSTNIDTIIKYNEIPSMEIPVIYIQMELCKMTLKDYLIQNELSYNEIKKIIYNIAIGIQYLHSKNIIHKDLSLKNILVDFNGSIKISDFGMAAKINFIDDNESQKSSNEHGTLIYMAPETKKDNIYSKQSDIYSFGIIYFELLSRFNTEMERIESIENIKKNKVNNDIKFRYEDEINFILKIINENPNDRPAIENIINFIYS